MNRLCVIAMATIVALAAGCNNPKSPDAVASDVAVAQEKAASAVADARNEAAKDSGSEQAKVDEASQSLEKANAAGAYDVALAKADGDEKVALEKCNVLGGDAQQACKDQANAQHDLAVANAKATLAKQNP